MRRDSAADGEDLAGKAGGWCNGTAGLNSLRLRTGSEASRSMYSTQLTCDESLAIMPGQESHVRRWAPKRPRDLCGSASVVGSRSKHAVADMAD